MPILRSLSCSSESEENSYNPNILSITIVFILEILTLVSVTMEQQLYNQRKRYHPSPPLTTTFSTEKAAQQSGWAVSPFGSNSSPSPTCPICLSQIPPEVEPKASVAFVLPSKTCLTPGEIKNRSVAFRKGADSPRVHQLTRAEFPACLL